MLTTAKLREYGANVDEGLMRCMNDEGFYLSLVTSALNDERVYLLEKEIDENDLDKAFETAHALKGMYGNLSLTPLFEPMNEMTELLRGRTQTDYSRLMSEAKIQYNRLVEMNK